MQEGVGCPWRLFKTHLLEPDSSHYPAEVTLDCSMGIWSPPYQGDLRPQMESIELVHSAVWPALCFSWVCGLFWGT